MRFYPGEKCLFIDEYPAADPAHYGVEAVLSRVENQMPKTAHSWPHVMLVPVGNRDESMLLHLRPLSAQRSAAGQI
jgi:hypothetical protein